MNLSDPLCLRRLQKNSQIVFLINSKKWKKNTTVLIEAESFQELGGWVIDQQFMDYMGSPFLLAHGMGVPVEDATTGVLFPEIGVFKVWVRTRDWAAPWKDELEGNENIYQPPGKFKLLVNGQSLDTAFGTEIAEWHWQYGGEVNIIQKENTSLLLVNFLH